MKTMRVLAWVSLLAVGGGAGLGCAVAPEGEPGEPTATSEDPVAAAPVPVFRYPVTRTAQQLTLDPTRWCTSGDLKVALDSIAKLGTPYAAFVNNDLRASKALIQCSTCPTPSGALGKCIDAVAWNLDGSVIRPADAAPGYSVFHATRAADKRLTTLGAADTDTAFWDAALSMAGGNCATAASPYAAGSCVNPPISLTQQTYLRVEEGRTLYSGTPTPTTSTRSERLLLWDPGNSGAGGALAYYYYSYDYTYYYYYY